MAVGNNASDILQKAAKSGPAEIGKAAAKGVVDAVKLSSDAIQTTFTGSKNAKGPLAWMGRQANKAGNVANDTMKFAAKNKVISTIGVIAMFVGVYKLITSYFDRKTKKNEAAEINKQADKIQAGNVEIAKSQGKSLGHAVTDNGLTSGKSSTHFQDRYAAEGANRNIGQPGAARQF